MTNYDELVQRCTDYLAGGGLFNPELANHQAVSELVRDCRDKLAELQAQKPVAWRFVDDTGRAAYCDTQVHKGWEPLYAKPVPAVDLAEFKREAMRLIGEIRTASNRDGVVLKGPVLGLCADLAAHLDKLGGK